MYVFFTLKIVVNPWLDRASSVGAAHASLPYLKCLLHSFFSSLTPATRLTEIQLVTNEIEAQIRTVTELLKLINESLTHCQLQVGYRTRDEMALFLINTAEVRSAFRTRDGRKIDPLDLAVSMKILPRIAGGSAAIRRTLIELLGITVTGLPFANEEELLPWLESWERDRRLAMLKDARFPRSAARLCLMWDRLESEGFTSYWL